MFNANTDTIDLGDEEEMNRPTIPAAPPTVRPFGIGAESEPPSSIPDTWEDGKPVPPPRRASGSGEWTVRCGAPDFDAFEVQVPRPAKVPTDLLV